MSTLRLYKQCKITRDRNARVDSLNTYLNSLTYTELDIQYQQIALNKTIKLELEQRQVGAEVYNYLDIYQDNRHFYYFINKARWKSTKTIEFDITLDTINTFAGDFTFNKKTRITRQHKDRLKKLWAWYSLDYTPLAYLTNAVYTFSLESDLDTAISWDEPGAPMQEASYPKYSVRDNEGNIITEYTSVFGVYYGDWGDGDGYGLHILYKHWAFYPELPEVRQIFVSKEQIDRDAAIGRFHCLDYNTIDSLQAAEYEAYNGYLYSGQFSDVYHRIIDIKSEEINPPLFKDGYERKVDDTNSSANWYLVYKANSSAEDSGIQCQLWPDREFQIRLKQSLNKQPSDFLSGNYYYIMPTEASHANIVHISRNFSHGNINTSEYMEIVDDTSNSVVGRIRNEPGDYHNDKGSYFCILYRDGSDLIIEEYMNKDNFWGQITTTKTNEFTLASGHTISFRYYQGDQVNYYVAGSKETNLTNIWNNCNNGVYNQGEWTATTEWKTLSPFNEIDRTDSRLVRIISIPYVVNMRYYMFDTNTWSYDTDGSFLYLNNPNTKLTNVIGDSYTPLNVLNVTYIEAFDELGNVVETPRNDMYESKLYNSEFYTPKFVYDSFSYTYFLENVDADLVNFSGGQDIKYTCSSLINSRFMWQFDVPLKRSISDYDNICIASRNNELPIYSNNYIDYIRTGYNYDVKNKQTQLTKGLLQTGISTVVAAGAGFAKGGVPGAIASAGITLSTSLINLAINQSQADRNIQQKLEEAQRQATSVVGGDDVDLLDIYTDGNKAKYVTYQCSDNVKQAMADVFYYCGYAEDVRAVPDLKTRAWFNFIQCEPVFNEETNAPYSNYSPYKEYLDDIKQRYQEGVTVYHRVNDSYDWDQEKENWETNLIN